MPDLPFDARRLERRVERAIQEEVHVAARLGVAVACIAQLLLDRQQLRAGAQHLVLGHLAVAVERVAHPQVLTQQRDARLHDADLARGLEPVEIADGQVALEAPCHCHAIELRRLELCALRADRRGNGRRVERLAEAHARVLLALALEVEVLVLDGGELGRPALRDEELIERRVHRVEERAHRQLELPATLGARVAGVEGERREEMRPRRIERGETALEDESLGAQRQVRPQRLADVIVDHRCHRTGLRAFRAVHGVSRARRRLVRAGHGRNGSRRGHSLRPDAAARQERCNQSECPRGDARALYPTRSDNVTVADHPYIS